VSLFVKHSDIGCYSLAIVVFHCANTTAFHMPNWKFSEVKLGCKMGCCMKEVENHYYIETKILTQLGAL